MMERFTASVLFYWNTILLKKNYPTYSIYIIGIFLCFSFGSINAQNCTGNNEIGGSIFLDYDGDGVADPFEGPVSGITITAYDSGNNVYGPVTVNESGEFLISVPNGTAVRLEYTNLPANFFATSVGTDSHTTVSFVSSPNCNAHLGLINSDTYCQNNPEIAVPCYVNGDPLLGGDAANAEVLVSFPYSAEGNTTSATYLAQGSEMGTVWGVAYNRKSQKVFSSAFLKRHSGFGILGTGGIYVTDLSGAVPVNSNFINLANLGINTGTIGVRDIPGNFGATSRDLEAFEKIGEIGLGDMDIAADGNTLYTVNLAERELVIIDITNYNNFGLAPTAANVTNVAIPNPGCSNGDYRPWALKVSGNKLYIGIVCSAETSQNRSDLGANVYEYNLTTGVFTTVLSFSLNYIKGSLTFFDLPTSDDCNRWEAWTDDYDNFYHTNLPNGICYPQPILSDIEFDVDGSMILSFMDRAGHQLGRENFSPDLSDFGLRTGVAGGDIIRAAPTSVGWQVEENGSAGTQNGCGIGNGQGIGGGEFYCEDTGAGGEEENSMGGLAVRFGTNQIVNSILNPFETNSGGIQWLDSEDGSNDKRFQLYEDAIDAVGKAHGLGDLELLCMLPPIEIGNYVWNDIDGDGVQDPDEIGIPNVMLNLYNESGNLLASTTTDNNGQYLFNDDNVPGGIQAFSTYYIALSGTQYDITSGLNVNSINFGAITDANVGAGANPDLNDSDAIAGSSGIFAIDNLQLPYILVNTDVEGATNHSFDFGVSEQADIPCPPYLANVNLSQTEICPGDVVTVTIEHSTNVGEIQILQNIGSILTASEIYSPDNGDADVIVTQVVPVPGTTVTTINITASMNLPDISLINTTDNPFPYNIYIALTDDNGNLDPPCLPLINVQVVVNPMPTASAGASQTICAGDATVLTASGGGAYLWNTGQNTASITVAPLTTTTYTVTVTNQYGCTDTDQATIVVNSVTANAGPDQTICGDNVAVLSASGGSSYQWSTGQNTAVITVSPDVTTTYTVTVMDALGCMDTDEVTVSVGSAAVSITPPQTICLGEITTITAVGSGTYQWSTGQETATITVSPAINSTYIVTVTDASGCSNTAQTTVSVGNVTAGVMPNQTICLGESVTLMASGGTFYQWSTGQTTASINVAPTVTTTYTVTASDANGCNDVTSVTVNVNNVTANAGPDQTICDGATTTLTATGGSIYQWSTGQNTQSINVAPAVTTTYTVTVSDGNGCTDTDQVTVVVGNITANAGPDQTICVGGTTTLTATGGSIYQWSTGQTTQSINVAPAVTTTYTVTVSDGNGCTDTDQVTVVVGNITANAGPDQTICVGGTTTLTATGGTFYQWSTGQTTQSINVSPTTTTTTTTTYTVTVSDANGCTDTDQVTVTVGNITANAGPDQTICDEVTTTLTATGGVFYEWNTGQNTQSINVAPAVTTTYTVTVSDANGCTDTDQVTVIIGNTIANAGPDQTVCEGAITTLTATGGIFYQWSTGQTTQSINVSPTTTTTYTVTVSDGSGCTDTDQVTVIVGDITANAGPDQTICDGGSTTLTATGGTFYEWSTGQTTQSINVSPTTTTPYTVTVSDANGCTDTDQVTVIVGNITANAGLDQTICVGGTITLTATGGTFYQWSTGQNTQSINVAPAVTTTYTVTVSDGNGCTDTDQVTVTVGNAIANAGPDQAICAGSSTILTAAASTSYQWSTGQTTQSITVAPIASTVYTLTVTDVNGCTGVDEVLVTVGDVIANAGPDQSICLGDNVTLVGTGGGTYQWSTGQTTQSISVNPLVTTTYTLTVTNGDGCTDTDQVTVSVSSVTATTSPNASICTGESATLTASGGVTYQWSNTQTGASIVVAPTVTTTYTVTVINVFGCTDTDQVTVTVGSAEANAGPDQVLCAGGSVTLTATGGTFYQWSNGQSTQSITVSPTIDTVYEVTVSDGEGCTDTDQVSVTVGNAIANAGPDQSICLGESVNLTATGGVAYMWNTGQSTQTIAVTPLVTTTYTVTVSSGEGCTDTDQVTVVVKSVTANAGPDQAICAGESATLTAFGGTSYQWSTGQTTQSISVNPIATTTYTVTVSDSDGCFDTDEIVVSVGDVTATASPDQIICLGNTTEISASGGVNYQWSTGQDTQAITVAPLVTTTYTVTVTDANGCTDTDQVTVAVENVLANAGPDQTVCLGDAQTLTASGGSSYVWSTGEATQSITVTPDVTTTYAVTVSNGSGCSDVDEVTVTISVVTANAGPDQTICAGESVSITATGGVGYTWSTGQTAQTINVSPLVTTTYIVTVTNANGCSDTDEMTVFVGNAEAEAGPDQLICEGNETTLTATGGVIYEWSSGQTTQSINVAPIVTTTYTVTVTDGNGCSDTDEVMVDVSNVTVNAGPDQTICLGEMATLSAISSEAVSYQWSTGQNSVTIFVSPDATTAINVTVTDANGCTAIDEVIINVEEVEANADPDQTICLGDMASVSVTSNVSDASYQWSTGQTTQSISVSPTVSTTYTVTVTSANGCTDTDDVSIEVVSVIANAGPDQLICDGEATTLTASGGNSYFWSTGQTTQSITVEPDVTTTYSVTVSNANGCTDTDEVTVTIGTADANAGPDQNICNGETATLTATGGASYVWSNGLTTQSITVNPTITTTYSVTVTDVNGCTDTDQVGVTVTTVVANAGPDQSICAGESVTLSASGGGTYVWSNGLTTQSITVSPLVTTTYTVTVSNGDCNDVDQVTVVVGNVEADAGPDQTTCSGQCVILTATGGVFYEWSNGATTASTSVSPSTTTTYTVTVTDEDGCTDTDQVTVFVNSIDAAISPDQTICEGESISITASGGASYNWSNGESGVSIVVSPLVTTTYTVMVGSSDGCMAQLSTTVFVTSEAIADAGLDQVICEGETATITATGGSSYQWSTGQTTATISVSPPVTTTYTVTVSSGASCVATDFVTIVVGHTVANAGPNQAICEGGSATLVGQGAGSFQWSNGQATQSITVSPLVTTTYTLTITDANGCTDTDQATIFVGGGDINADAGTDQTSCAGECVVLSATGGMSYVWSNGAVGPVISVTPNATTSYTVTVSDEFGCTDTDQVTVAVIDCDTPPPPPVACEDITICTMPIMAELICPNFSECIDGSFTVTEVSSLYECSTEIIGNCVEYIALPGMEGVTDIVTLTACGASGCETVTITVFITEDGNCPGENPIANNDNVTTTAGEAISIDVTDNDIANGTSLTVTTLSNPSNGTITIVGNNIVYIPTPGFVGFDNFTYQICNEAGLCDQATVSIQVSNSDCTDTQILCAEPVTPIVLCPEFCDLTGAVSLVSVTTTYNCSIDMLDDGSNCFEYTSLPLFSGSETITVIGMDAFGNMDTVFYQVGVTDDCSGFGGFTDVGGEANPQITGKLEGSTDNDNNNSILESNLMLNSITPNPSSNFIDVNFNAGSNAVHLTVFDMYGQMVNSYDLQAAKGNSMYRLSVADLPAGAYIVQISTSNGMVSAKFVKQ